MCYNKSMERIDVLKGIEQILVQKAYETGHISHRADGDWQKQADGSWIPYKGQSTPQAQENSPTTNNKGRGIVNQDFESVPKSIKDKMFTIAQQYQSEWAEDSDEDVRSMAENDVEDISQMLWDNADEETRSSWIGSENSNEKDSNASTVDLYSDDQIGFSSYANNINIDNGVADNDDLEDVANQILIDNDLEITDENMNKARNGMLSWLDANGYLDSDDVEKSAVRDMRSASTTKNMGF